MTCNEFNIWQNNIIKKTNDYINTHPYLKQGEIIFKLTAQDFPATVNRIKNTKADPTENDNNITQFWNLLKIKLIN